MEAVTNSLRELRRELDQLCASVQEVHGCIEVAAYRIPISAKMRALILRFAPEAELLHENFDLCITGVTQLHDRHGSMQPRVVYDIDKLVQIYAERGVAYEQAMGVIADLQAAADRDRGPVLVLQLSVTI